MPAKVSRFKQRTMFDVGRSRRRTPRRQAGTAGSAEFYQRQQESEVRDRVRKLIGEGVHQKVIASRMGVSESWLSRWLNGLPVRPLTVDAKQAFDHYAEHLAVIAGSRR
jgi:DNA invertase Pin-like site-specific DNA recombinase